MVDKLLSGLSALIISVIAGLGIAVAALVLVSAAASRSFRPVAAIMLALLLAVFSIAVFVKGLGLPFAALPWFPG